MFSGYRVSVLQDEKRAGDVMYSHAHLVNPPVYFKVLSWFILYYVLFFFFFLTTTLFLKKSKQGKAAEVPFAVSVVGLQWPASRGRRWNEGSHIAAVTEAHCERGGTLSRPVHSLPVPRTSCWLCEAGRIVSLLPVRNPVICPGIHNTQSTVAGLWNANPALSELELLTPFSATGFAENDFAMNRFVHSFTESHDCVPGTVLGAEDTGGLGADFVELTATEMRDSEQEEIQVRSR